ncbi:MAG: TIR domain-containing protein [Aureispira sp.]
MTRRHKTFVSYHHANDQDYKNRLEQLCQHQIVTRSVQMGDIDPNTSTDNIRRIIREQYLRDSTVTVVLIGRDTWKRKHVDWEIGASIRQTQYSSRSGLLGIFLPSHPDYGQSRYNKHTIPPRLADNVDCGFAKLYDWDGRATVIQDWIHEAYQRRGRINPDNSYPNFGNNRPDDQREWQ